MIRKYRGEILIPSAVMYVIALLFFASAAFVGGKSFLNAAKNNRALADTANLASCISQYKLEVGSYPSSLNDLTNQNGQYGPWLKDIPKDPYNNNNNYQYSYNAAKGYIIYSVGNNGSSDSSLDSGIGGDDLGYIGF